MHQIEKEKYEKMWLHPAYRVHSPGLNCVEAFLTHFHGRFQEGDTLIDFGCGSGRAGFHFFFQGFSVCLVDIAANCLDEAHVDLLSLCSERICFLQACLWDLPPSLQAADWIYCCDVLEHLPDHTIDRALQQMAMRCKKGGFFQIFLQDEPYGKLISESLHLTIRPQEWWLEKIKRHFTVEAFGPEIPGFRFSTFLSRG